MHLFRNKPEVPPLAQPWRENNYTWDGPRAWACFRPNADVLVPMYFTYATADIVSPFASSRDITALARFGYEIGDGKNLVEHYGHRLRYELIEYWKEHPLEGSQQGLASVEVRPLMAVLATSSLASCPNLGDVIIA